MPNPEIFKQLLAIAEAMHFVAESYPLTDAWMSSGVGIESVEPILRFMETHPDIDYGVPGPLVHFVERFCDRGYETKLIESVLRKPTAHTVWMVNRLINGTKVPEVRLQYFDILEQVRSNPSVDQLVRREAADFLEYQRS
jgi:hypothetical protein